MPDWAAYVRERLRLGDLRPEREAEIVEDIAGQLEEAYQESLRQGLNEAEAEAAAAAHVSDWDALSAAIHESPDGPRSVMLSPPWRAKHPEGAEVGSFLAGLWRDILYGLRLLAKNRGFAAAAILTMAIGIGANTAVFSIIDATLFFPLPYPQANRIVYAGRAPGFVFLVWANRNKVFTAMGADDEDQATLTGTGTAERVDVAKVTAGFFPTFGIRPMLGRGFLPSETQPGGTDVAILGYELWRDRFAGRPSVIGQAIHLDDRLYTVVGVLPRRFVFPDWSSYRPAALLPLHSYGNLATNARGEVISESGEWLDCFGRLKPGVSATAAQADLNVISRGRPGVAGWARGMEVPSLRDYLVGNTRPELLLFWGAVGFLLLIACVNVANLALARALGREKEIAVRVALGAHRRRVARQLLTENVLLATLGGLAGIAIAYVIVVLVRSLGPSDIPRLRQATIDLPVLAFTVVLAGLAGILAGLAPVRAAWKLSTVEALKEGARTSSSRGHRRLRSALVVAEIAMALVLAIGSLLLVRSFLGLINVPLHFDPHNLLTAQVALPQPKYPSPAQRRQFEQSLLADVQRLPGVTAASATADMNTANLGWHKVAVLQVQGQPMPKVMRFMGAGFVTASSGFFSTAGIRFLEGRDFLPTDSATSRQVAIVNQSFAHNRLPGMDPLGQNFRQGIRSPEDTTGWIAIVGVVANLHGDFGQPVVYLPYAQHPTPDLTLLIRTRGNPMAIVPALRSQVEELDSDLPVFNVATMDHLLGEQVATPRFNTLLLGAFALIALVLAALGVYGVISYAVSERTHEIGIRLALGAEKAQVMRMIIGRTLLLALVGIGIGLGGALALTRYLRSLLYQIRPDDPWTFALAAAVLLAAALLAGFLPARRATKVDPISALRYE